MVSNESIVAGLIGTTGALAVHYLDGWWSRRIKKTEIGEDEAVKLRQELREEIANLRKEVSALREDIDEWRQKYYDLLEAKNRLQVEYDSLSFSHRQLKDSHTLLEAKVQILEDRA